MRRPLRAVVLGVVGGATAMVAARLAYFGAPFPHSVAVKGFTASAGFGDGVHYLARGVFEWWPLLVGVPVLWRHRRPLFPAIAAAAAWAALVVARGGDWMPGSRYFLPLLVLLVGAAAVESADRLGRWTAPMLAAWGCFLLVPLSDPAVVVPGRMWRSMQTPRAQSAWFEGLGAYLRSAVPHGTTLASGPAGALPYASRLATFDLYGLCSLVTHVNAIGHTGHRLWGLDDAAGRADVIYMGKLGPQNSDARAVLLAAEKYATGVTSFPRDLSARRVAAPGRATTGHRLRRRVGAEGVCTCQARTRQGTCRPITPDTKVRTVVEDDLSPRGSKRRSGLVVPGGKQATDSGGRDRVVAPPAAGLLARTASSLQGAVNWSDIRRGAPAPGPKLRAGPREPRGLPRTVRTAERPRPVGAVPLLEGAHVSHAPLFADALDELPWLDPEAGRSGAGPPRNVGPSNREVHEVQ